MTKSKIEETINSDSLSDEIQDSSNADKTKKEESESKTQFRLTWGNPKALVLLGGNVIMWVLAVLFFAVRIDGTSLLGSESLPVACEVMLGICSVVVAVMIALFIMSIVLFVKNLKETKTLQDQ